MPYKGRAFFLSPNPKIQIKMYKYKSKSLTILNGETSADDSLKLPAGTCFKVWVSPSGTEPAKPVYLSVKDGGNEVVETINHKFYFRTAGVPDLPLEFKCDRNVEIEIVTSTAVGADYTVDVLFVIKQENY